MTVASPYSSCAWVRELAVEGATWVRLPLTTGPGVKTASLSQANSQTKPSQAQVSRLKAGAGAAAGAQTVRSSPKHRYCWAVGATPLVRAFRRRKLAQRIERFHFVPAYQPRLLARVWQALAIVAHWRPRRI
jgi:hypothetical protein